jgi:DNA-binding transcriptional LysR family regulator
MAANYKLLEGIVAFVEVVTSGSFTNAAERSGHSTSFISKEITKLEERLGVRLLNRTTRSLSLTPEGEIYFQQCQQIVDDAQLAESSMGGKQAEPQGLLKVSCPVSFGLSKVNPILPEFSEMYPKVKLEVDLSDRKVDLVTEGFDVVIRASTQLEDSSLISRRIMRTEALTLAAPDYLKKYGTPKHPDDLRNHKCLTYSYLKKPNQWKYLDSQGQPFLVEVPSSFMTNSPEMELAMCKAGQGITRLPTFNLQNEIERGELVRLFDDFKPIDIDVFLVYPSRKHISTKLRCFIDFVVERLGDSQ